MSKEECLVGLPSEQKSINESKLIKKEKPLKDPQNSSKGEKNESNDEDSEIKLDWSDSVKLDWSVIIESESDDGVDSLSSMEEPFLSNSKIRELKVQKEKEKIIVEEDFFRNHKEFTLRAVIVGVLIGVVVCAINVNFGLRTGWCQGGSIFGAICAIGIFRLFDPKKAFTKYEATVAITISSSCGIMVSCAGLVSSMPALQMLNFSFPMWKMVLWAFTVGIMGVYFAFFLRKIMIIQEKLRFPTGTATAETIKAMVIGGKKAMYKTNVLLVFGGLSSVWAIISFFLPVVQQPPMFPAIGKYGFNFYLNPLLIGGGMLSGFRSSFSLLIGTLIGWGILAPIAENLKWVHGNILSIDGARGWILWVGIAVMLGETTVNLLLSSKYLFIWVYKFIKVLVSKDPKKGDGLRNLFKKKNWSEFIQANNLLPKSKSHVNFWLTLGGFIVSSIILVLVGSIFFEIQFYFILIAIPLSFFLSLIAIKATGETDINPVGVIGKVTQLIFAFIAPGKIKTNLLSAGIVGAGASQSGDMMQDLKAGYIIRIAPKKQMFAQIIGIIIGCFTSVFIYYIYKQAYVIGSNEMPAPAAQAWKAFAELLNKGTTTLPKYCKWGMLVGYTVGVILCFSHQMLKIFNKQWAKFVPSGLAIGLGMLVPAKQCISMFAGALGFVIWYLIHKKSASKYYFSVSSGLITGEALMGIMIAIGKFLGIQPLVQPLTYPPH